VNICRQYTKGDFKRKLRMFHEKVKEMFIFRALPLNDKKDSTTSSLGSYKIEEINMKKVTKKNEF